MDVEFHDAAIRPFHFTDYNKFTLAALGSMGAAFASRSTASLASTIYYYRSIIGLLKMIGVSIA